MKLCWKKSTIVIKYYGEIMIKLKNIYCYSVFLPLFKMVVTQQGILVGAATIEMLMIENKHNTIPNIQTPVNYGNLENQQQLASK